MMLHDIICDKMSALGCEELSLVLDARFVQRYGKRVYVKLVTNRDGEHTVSYCIKSPSGVTNIDMGKELQETVEASSLYGISVEGSCSVRSSNVNVCTSLQLLLVESCLYQTIKQVACSSTQNVRLQLGGVMNAAETTRSLLLAFKNNAFLNYGDLIYGTSSNRFLNKLLKVKKFYSIQKTFVPVFVDYKPLYNPFSDKNLHIEDTRLYKTAVEKGRFIEVDEKLSGYLLTHREICECFGMTHFMRFTPNFCYKIFVGLLDASMPGFPNKYSMVMAATANVSEYGLKRSYSIGEFLKEKEKLTHASGDGMLDKDAAARALEALRALDGYREVDTLYEHTMLAYSRLVNVGPTSLDASEDKTLAKIYSYIGEADLLM